MMSHPLISFHVNSFNRLPLLRNLLRSFELCNQYPNVEWIITDYGSTDGSRDYISHYAATASFAVRYIFGNEKDYFQAIRDKGLPIDSRWAKFRAILSRFRNDARAAAQGEYIIDVADDHQFIRRGNWVDEIRTIVAHREAAVGRDDIAGIVPYGYPRWRLDKPNNSRGPVQGTEPVTYYVAREKSYVDYSVMKRATYEAVGRYLEPLDFLPGSEAWEMWDHENDLIQPEAEYERRCAARGLKRIFMKYPFIVSFPNTMQFESVSTTWSPDRLICRIWTNDEMHKEFGQYNRPISSDELLGLQTSWLRSRWEFIKDTVRS